MDSDDVIGQKRDVLLHVPTREDRIELDVVPQKLLALSTYDDRAPLGERARTSGEGQRLQEIHLTAVYVGRWGTNLSLKVDLLRTKLSHGDTYDWLF